MSFVHLHGHSDRSALDAQSTPAQIAIKIKELGQPAVALTDHGVCWGLVEHYLACKKQEVKPILGMEAYLSPTDDHTIKEKIEGEPNYYHLILLAKNNIGVKELFKLSSLGFLEGFYYKPRISIPLLEAIGKNLIVMTACLSGPVYKNYIYNRPDYAYKFAERFKSIYKDDFYIEIMDHGIKEEIEINPKLLQLAEDLQIKVVPTNDFHFTNEADHYNHSLMLCIRDNKNFKEMKEADKFYPSSCYIKSTEEMINLFGIELCNNTIEVSEKCNTELELGKPIFTQYIE